MGKRYYCDFCDKSFSDNVQSRKRHFQGLSHQRQRRAHYDQFKHELVAKKHAKTAGRVPGNSGREILAAWLARNPQVVDRARQRGVEVNLPDVIPAIQPPQFLPKPQQPALAAPGSVPIADINRFPAVRLPFPPPLMSPTQLNVASFPASQQGIPNVMFPMANVSQSGTRPLQSLTHPPGSHPGIRPPQSEAHPPGSHPGTHPLQSLTHLPGSHPGTHPLQSGTYPLGSHSGTHPLQLGPHPPGLSLTRPSSSTSQLQGSQSGSYPQTPFSPLAPGSQSGSHFVGASSSLPHPLTMWQNPTQQL